MLGNGYLYFSGQDVVTIPPFIPALRDNFTFECWAIPGSPIQLVQEANAGITGLKGQRYLIGANHGGKENAAGICISVGTNGVAVYEHAVNHLPATLVWPSALDGWTHIALVYRNKTPHLYVNGEVAKTGLASRKEEVSAFDCMGGLESYGYYIGYP